jgi:protein-arginine deiminase
MSSRTPPYLRRLRPALLLCAGLAVGLLGIACGNPPVAGPPDSGDPFVPPVVAACTSGDTRPCYTGPAGTAGVGACQGGEQSCDNGRWGACVGEVVPTPELCATPVDDDCNGLTNEEGPDCACNPGDTAPCYTGPVQTYGVGACKAGTQSCNAAGTGWGACQGDVTPAPESCLTPEDDDCDGLTNEGGAGCVCAPGSSEPCYTGPAGTQNVGICQGGTRQCNAQGTGWGGCAGEVTPTTESCLTPDDDDCDGQTNEGGQGCVCVPGSSRACYTGPAGTQNVGICKGGTETCNGQGTGYGPCAGQVVPQVEDCNTPADENCDGQAPGCGVVVPIIDLRADTNRNGVVDLTDPTEDLGEDVWTTGSGAIFLANIDDDQGACPTTGTDAQLAACNDAADNVVNGAADLEDLARLKTVPWPDAPSDASATLSVSAPGASYVRLFKKVNGTFTHFVPSTGTVSAAELQAGVEFAIEGKDVIRDSAVWDGKVTVTLNVDAGTGPNGPLPDGSDSVQLRMAPVVFRHHLDPTTRVYYANINSSASLAFRNDVNAAVAQAGVPGPTLGFNVSDQWTQDYLETAYMAMPAPGGQQKVIHVNVRSANYGSSGTLRSAGRVVYTVLRGPDAAGLTSYSPTHSNSMDTLNSFGNLETLPPYTKNGTTYTLGKVLRGSTSSYYPDPVFDKMVTSQGVQGILYVDTSWLLVAHVDETVSFIRASSPRGWVMVVADPVHAKNELQLAQSQGHGATKMFVGKYWSALVPAEVSINQVLADADVMNESAWAAVKIDSQVAVIKAETGLTSAELVPVGSLFQKSSGYSLAYEPGMVNGIYLSDTVFGAPKPHGPVINGVDLFRADLEAALSPYGVQVAWIEDWDLYHRNAGEVHCGSNTTRAVPAQIKWWESGL